jgi:hypothetical protein
MTKETLGELGRGELYEATREGRPCVFLKRIFIGPCV